MANHVFFEHATVFKVTFICIYHSSLTSTQPTMASYFGGFWEGSYWKKECASWNLDWSIRERGKVLEEWVCERWRTEPPLPRMLSDTPLSGGSPVIRRR